MAALAPTYEPIETAVKRLDSDQQLIFGVLRDIFDLFVAYELIDERNICWLLSAGSRDHREAVQRKIALAIVNKERTNKRLSPVFFDPWSKGFYRRDEICRLMNNNAFWDQVDPRLRAMRGLLTAILREYRNLRGRIVLS